MNLVARIVRASLDVAIGLDAGLSNHIDDLARALRGVGVRAADGLVADGLAGLVLRHGGYVERVLIESWAENCCDDSRFRWLFDECVIDVDIDVDTVMFLGTEREVVEDKLDSLYPRQPPAGTKR